MTLRNTLLLSVLAHGMAVFLSGDNHPALTTRRGQGPVVIENPQKGVSHLSGRKGSGHEKSADLSTTKSLTEFPSAERETKTLGSGVTGTFPAGKVTDTFSAFSTGVSDGSDIGIAPPAYPELARLRGEEGTVLLNLQLDAQTRLGSVEVARSSGFASLDRAALAAVRQSLVPSAGGPHVLKQVRFVFKLRKL